MAEYSQNDWRSYLQHDDKKWTWPNGNNSKEYNHWYYTTHPEKWIREKTVEGVKKIGEYAIDKAIDLYDKYFPKESDEEKDYYVENGVNRLKLPEDESQKEDPKVKVEVHADLSNVVKKGESDDDWYVKDGVYRLKDDEYRAEEARTKEEQERRTHELAEDLQTFNKYARIFHSELSHHGILGQKWGQQNGPPYPLKAGDHSVSEKKAGWKESLKNKAESESSEIIKKGTKLNSISPYENTQTYRAARKRIYTYDSDNEWDNKVYKGPFALYKMQTTGYMQNEHKFKAAKDLKTPTETQRFNDFVELYDSNVRKYSKELERTRLMTSKISNLSDLKRDSVNFNPYDMKTEDDYRRGYVTFNTMMEAADHFNLTRAYIKSAEKKYDAMADDNNRKVYNDVQSATIVFEPRKNLEIDSKKGNYISYPTVLTNFTDVEDELKKKGKNIAL